MTLIGHEAVTYPTGTLWTGDFSFPHQVESPTNGSAWCWPLMCCPGRRCVACCRWHWRKRRRSVWIWRARHGTACSGGVLDGVNRPRRSYQQPKQQQSLDLLACDVPRVWASREPTHPITDQRENLTVLYGGFCPQVSPVRRLVTATNLGAGTPGAAAVARCGQMRRRRSALFRRSTPGTGRGVRSSADAVLRGCRLMTAGAGANPSLVACRI
jgi:hypothetical protein